MMKYRTAKISSFVFLCLAAFMIIGSVSVAETGLPWKEKRKKEIADQYNRHTIPIMFYGKVVDLDGNSVSDAEITMRLTWLPPTPMLEDQKLLKTTTDQNGCFSIEATGYQLYLVDVAKEGYQYHFKYNPARGFRFIKGKKKAELGQIKDHPAVFKVRKKGIPTLVLTGHASFQLQPGSGSIRIFDLMKQSWTYPKFLRTEKLNFKDWHEDFQISLEKEGKIYQLIFKALDDGTGIVMGELEQYTAPEKGYKPELVLSIPESEPTTERWLFMEGRGGVFYSMLQVETHPSDKWVNVRIGYGTNPNGSRNLEYSPELAKEYQDKKYGRNKE